MQAGEVDPEFLKEIREAYSLFVRAVPRKSTQEEFGWRPPAHRCNEHCPVMKHKNVVVCISTGNWHYCTRPMCDRLIANHEIMVCPLSGNTFSLDLEFDEFQQLDKSFNNEQDADEPQPPGDDYGDADVERRQDTEEEAAAAAPKIKRRKKKHKEAQEEAPSLRQSMEVDEDEQKAESDAQWADEEHVVVDATAAAAATEPKQEDNETGPHEFLAARRINMSFHHARLALFETMLNHMFRPHVQTHGPKLKSIAANAERLWALVQSTEAVTTKKQR